MLNVFKQFNVAAITLLAIAGCSTTSTANNLTVEKTSEDKLCVVHKNSVCKIAMHPNEKVIAIGSSDNQVKLWHKDNKQELHILPHPEGVPAVAFSVDGELLATGSYDNNVRIWQVASGELLQTFEGHTNMVVKFAFSPDGKSLASVSADDTARIWQLGTGKSKRLSAHQGDVWGIAYSPDGKWLLTGGEDNVINVWHANSGEHVTALTDHSGAVLDLAFSPDGKLLASGGDDYTIKLWDTNNWQVINTLDDDGYSIYSLSFSPDGKSLVSGGRDKGLMGEFLQYHWQYHGNENNVTMRIWQVEAGKVIQRLNGHQNDVSNVIFNSDGTTLLSSGVDGNVIEWQINR